MDLKFALMAEGEKTVLEIISAKQAEDGSYVTKKGKFNKDLKGLRDMKGYNLYPLTSEMLEDFEAKKLQKEIDYMRRSNFHLKTPPESRRFRVGDVVSCGSYEKVTIEKIIEDHTFYLINYTLITERYGKENILEGQKAIVAWTLVFPLTSKTETIFHTGFRMKLDFHKADIRSLLHEYYSWGIDMKPEYQRGYVWNDEAKVQLIDSIYKGIDIGKFVLIEKEKQLDDCLLEVLDGKQRISTIVDYVEDRLMYKGLLFSQIQREDRQYFMNTFRITLAMSRDTLDIKERYEYFIRLNSQGVVMDSKHLAEVIERYNAL